MEYYITSWEREGDGYAWRYVATLNTKFTSYEKVREYQMFLIMEKVNQGLSDYYTYHIFKKTTIENLPNVQDVQRNKI